MSHTPTDGHDGDATTQRPANRLAGESSPYLLQHAHNPVDWFPWGEEAFTKARDEDKPVFLSIGYSTCHWCHVMERESFENEEIAAYLNEHFVAIKVDREERPDVDTIYMTAIQATGQGGGWPLSAFLHADGKPFFLGTYFPPEDRYGRPGFMTVLHKMKEAWDTRREDVRTAGGEFADFLATQSGLGAPESIGPATLEECVSQYESRFDGTLGGFGSAPKFPRAHSLSFLLRMQGRKGGPRAREMAVATLEAMARGGMHDHVGGGFHRYSTDARWLVPHFEKMLYDQATLAVAYTEAWQATGNPAFARAARGTFEYVMRDLTHRDGGFLAAEDADSEGVEGKFYVWTEEELRSLLPPEIAPRVVTAWGVKPGGNFNGEAEEAPEGANILHLPGPAPDIAAGLEIDEDLLLGSLDTARRLLLEQRSTRVRPHLDDKVLAAWNGLMIGAFARAGRAFDEPQWIAAAGRAADFVLEHLVIDGRLHRSWREGRTGTTAFLDDHAFLALGLLDLYEATGELRWLDACRRITADMRRLFADPSSGGFWDAASDAEALIARTRDAQDWALPSGNSGAALLLLRLGRLCADPEIEGAGRAVLRTFSGNLARLPMGSPFMLMALEFDLGPTREIVLAGDRDSEAYQALERAVADRFLPNTVTLHRPGGESGDAVLERLPWLKDYGPVNGKAAAYVCSGGTCRAPVTDAEALQAALGE